MAHSASTSQSSNGFLRRHLLLAVSFLLGLSIAATSFAVAGSFYAVTPCRVSDPRGAVGP